MDYTEIKERLTACEIKLQALQRSNQDVKNTQQYNMAVKKLTVLKESLQKRLKEADAKGVVHTKDSAKAKELADKGVNVELSEEESALNKFSDYSNKELMAYIKNTNDSEAKKEFHKRMQNLKKLTRDDVEESMDVNDPVMMRLRAAKMKRASSQSQTSSKGSSNDAKIAALKKRRAELMRDMEQEAEPEGGPIADEYGEKLNKIDKAIAKLSGQGEWGRETNPYMDKDEIERRAATLGESMSDEEWSDAAEAERLVNHPERSTIEKIKALIAAQNKSVEEPGDKLSRAAKSAAELGRKIAFRKGDTQHGKMERPNLRIYSQMHGVDEDIDIGHQDDEPNMVKKDLYDIITYAAKLYKQVNKYDSMEAEVDFPQWWQKKVILARDYMSAAQHYLESEEKQPAIDQLALENKSVKEERKLTYSDFVRMTADDMKAGAASDEYASDEQIKKVAKWKYTEYLKGEKVDDLFEGPAGPSIDKMSREDMIDFLNTSPEKVKHLSDQELKDAVMDKNSDMNEKTDYQKRREAESDYKPSKRDVPPKKYREPKNDYFARRKAEMDEALNPEVTKSLDQFIKSIAKRYDYSEQDAVYAIMQALRQTSFKGINEGTDLYDRNGIQITRFSGGSKGVMVQISYGGKYIHVPASEYPFLVRAMQSAKEDLKDMSRQLPRDKNMEEASHGKIQKDYGYIVAHMKELAKLYKAGDKSVVKTLKDLTARKKELEKQLEKAVAGTNRNQQLDPSGLDEQKATCCGKCGRVHVKGTKCKTPYLKGKDHCRYN